MVHKLVRMGCCSIVHSCIGSYSQRRQKTSIKRVPNGDFSFILTSTAIGMCIGNLRMIKNWTAMLSKGWKRGIMIIATLLFQLVIASAVWADTGSDQNTPWYAAWYLWIGLGVFIIVIISVVGDQRESE